MRLDLIVHRRSFLTAELAMGHMHHFCDVLPCLPYVDLCPTFTFEDVETGLINRTIILPSCLNPLVRCTS
jgi:hypothetical protein